MSFSTAQIRKLLRDVKISDIRNREVNGRELSYIEGWHAIAEANRIFGFDGWNRETIESRCVMARENRGQYHAVYVAKVRITVRAEGEQVIREGFGTGEAQGGTVGEVHEKAVKTAETDATKRALATFGKPFGLALYLGAKRRPEPSSARRAPDIDRRRTLQKLGSNGRYYVPARTPVPPLDPSLQQARDALAATAQAQDAPVASAQNPPPTEPSPEPLDRSIAPPVPDTPGLETKVRPVLPPRLKPADAPQLDRGTKTAKDWTEAKARMEAGTRMEAKPQTPATVPTARRRRMVRARRLRPKCRSRRTQPLALKAVC